MDNSASFKLGDISENENVIRVIHRSWFDMLSQYFLVFFILGTFSVISFIYPLIFPQLQYSESRPFFLFIENIFILVIWIYSFLIWIDYYFDIWVITDKRIINIEQTGLFSRKVSELKFEKIQDVTTEVRGFFQTVIDYGDVRVQTAAEEKHFLFRRISHPYEVKNLIMKIQEKKENKGIDTLKEILGAAQK